MTHPLTRHKNRHFDVQLDATHLKRRAVTMLEQIMNETSIITQRFCSRAIRDTRRLHNGSIIAHVINNPQKTMIENLKRLTQNRIQQRRRRTRELGGGRGVLFHKAIISQLADDCSLGWSYRLSISHIYCVFVVHFLLIKNHFIGR